MIYPGKDFSLIVDYNGMLKSLREALAQYMLGDDGTDGDEIIAPIEERVQALIEAIEPTEAHLRGLGFDAGSLTGTKGLARIKSLADAVDAVYSSDEAKRWFEILARQVFIRFRGNVPPARRIGEQLGRGAEARDQRKATRGRIGFVRPATEGRPA